MPNLYDAITDAHRALRPQVMVTPLTLSKALSDLSGAEVYLKCDHVMTTGSFKFRGACNKIRLLAPPAKKDGVIVASSGNHGLAVALAGRMAQIPVTVYTSKTTDPVKLKAIRSYGAELITRDATGLEIELEARQQAQQQGKIFVSPYNDFEVIAGQGTIGIEILAQCHDVQAVFAAVGGGGLISGLGTAVKATKPDTQIIGCWPAQATSLYSSLDAGAIISVEEFTTLSDGTAGEVEPDSVTFPICQRVIDAKLLVSEGEIKNAMKTIAQTDQWIIEGAAGVALGAFLQQVEPFKGKKVVIVLCGRNIALEKYLKAIAL